MIRSCIHRLRAISVFALWAAGPFTGFAQEQITLLHWNDYHAQNRPLRLVRSDSTSPWVGGAAVFKAYLDSMRAVRPNSLALHAGDEFQGSPISTLTYGRSQIFLLNHFQPDAFELGNHEFDYGRGRLEACLEEARFPVLVSNLVDSLTGRPFAKPFLVRRVGKVRVGIIGVITEDLPRLTLPANIRGLRVERLERAVRRYLGELKGRVDLVVVLSHSGFQADSLLALRLPEIDVIVGGHSHTALFTPRQVNGVIIVQAGSRSRYLGVLDLWVDLETNSVVHHNGRLVTTYVDRITPDRRMKALVDSMEAAANTELDQVVGRLAQAWVRNYNGESNIGNWQTDVMREFTGADVAFQNSGGIRKGLPPGPIRVRDLWEINPFSNYFLVFEVTGKELLQILEKQLSSPLEYLQVSGLRVRYDPARAPGQRVVEVFVGDGRLDPNKTYKVATNNYVFSHFEEFFGIPKRDRPTQIFQKLDRDVFLEAVKRAGVVHSGVEGRVTAASSDRPSETRSPR